MSENFEKLKKKYLFEAITASAVIGVSCGLFIIGVLLLSLKLSSVSLNAGYYVLIGICSALLGGAALFLVLRPTEKKVAKKLDDNYVHYERVQTMVAYKGEEGDIVNIQREDTEQKLSQLSKKKRKFNKSLIALIIVPVVALGLFLGGLLVPAKEANDNGDNQGEIPDPPADVTDFQLVSLNNLIEDVRNSSLGDTKEPVIAQLESLRDNLEFITTQKELESEVRSTITSIDNIFNKADTYINIGAAMAENEQTEWLNSLFLHSVSSYQGYASYKVNGKFTAFDQVQAVESLIEGYIGGAGGANETYLIPVKQDYAGLEDEEAIQESLQVLSDLITGGLKQSLVSETDALYSGVSAFADGLNVILGKIGRGYAIETLQKNIDEAFDNLGTALIPALDVQAYNVIMDDYVRQSLADIFGITPPSNSSSGITDVTPGSDDEEENNDAEGGAGRGDTLYGGDGYIYDPNSSQQVQYGEVLNDYYAKAMELLLGGDLSEELTEYIMEYYNILYSGLED